MANFRATPDSQPGFVEIVGGSTFGVFPQVSSALTQNMMVSDGYLISFPGYKKRIAPSTPSRGRGLFHSTRSNVMVQVIGSRVSVIDTALGVVTVPGNLASQVGEVYMDENLNAQVAIVDGINVYILNLTLPYSLTQQSGAPLGSDLIPNYVRFHDTFFLIGNGNLTSSGAKWWAYSYATPTTITPTTQLQLQTKPDFALAIVPIPSAANNVLVMGSTVCEVQQHIGGTQNYRRDQSVNIDFGCLSVATIASSDKHVVWLGVNADNGPTLMKFEGNQASTISTDGISNLLALIKHPTQSTAFFQRVAGHLLYQITFFAPDDNISVAYDFKEDKFYHVTDQHQGSHPAVNVVYFGLKSYFLSYKNGAIYETSLRTTFIDENIPINSLDPAYDATLLFTIPRMRITNDVSQSDTGRFRGNSFVFQLVQGNDDAFTELDLFARYPNLMITEDDFEPPNVPILSETGQYMIAEQPNITPPVGLVGELQAYLPPVSVGYRPRVDCSISIDDGVTFGNIVSRGLNPLGHRKNIITFGNMGACNVLTIKLQFIGLAEFIVSNGMVQVY